MNSLRLVILVLLTYVVPCIALNDSTETKQPLQIASIGLIKVYQAVSKLVPFEMCIFEPSCSNFAIEAVGQYGTFKGIQISANRIMRCNPSRKFEKESRYIPLCGKLYDPPGDYVSHHRTFSADFILPGIFQFRKGEVFDGVLAVGFTGVPVYALVRSDFKLNVANVVFFLVGAIFYSGHINYCYTYPP